jgi:uncharacterized protein
MNKTLIIFSRYPEAGKTKTRMIPALGALGAAKLQREMTEHTLKTAIALGSVSDIAIQIHFAGGEIQLMKKWLGADFDYIPQAAGDLGTKMRLAFDFAFRSGNQQVVIIGTDCPDLDQEILTTAFNSLAHHDLVLGVAADGGYYLIGLHRPIKELFQNISWGTEQVLSQTKNIAQQLKLDVDYLPTLGDVDRPQDLNIWQKYT